MKHFAPLCRAAAQLRWLRGGGQAADHEHGNPVDLPAGFCIGKRKRHWQGGSTEPLSQHKPVSQSPLVLLVSSPAAGESCTQCPQDPLDPLQTYGGKLMQTPDQTCPWGFPDGLLTSFISSLFIPSPTNKLRLLNLPPHAGTLLSQAAASPWAAGLLLHSLPSGDEIPGRKQSSTVSLHGEAGPVVPIGRPWCTAGQGGRTARQHGLCLLTTGAFHMGELEAWTSDISCREITYIPSFPPPALLHQIFWF